MTAAQCLLNKAAAGRVNAKAAKQLVGAYQAIAQANPGLPAGQVAARAVQFLQGQLTKQKQQVALQVQAAQRVKARMADGTAAGASPEQAMNSLLDFDPNGKVVGENVAMRIKDIRGSAHALFSAGLRRFRTKTLGFRQDTAGLRSMVKEIFGEQSGDASAGGIAKAWGEVDKYLVQRFRNAGGNLAEFDEWRLPQHHDWRRVRSVSKDDWVEETLPMLDRQRMIDEDTGLPFTDNDLRSVMGEVYDTIANNGLNRLVPGTPFGKKLANKHTDSRFLHFKDSDAWLAYDEKFGSGGDVFSVMMGHIEQRSREIAQLEVLGPNPEATVRAMVDRANIETGLRGSPQASGAGARVQRLYDTVSGKTSIPQNQAMANTWQSLRNVLTSAQLGGAFLSATADLNFQRSTAAFNGIPQFRLIGQVLQDFFVSGTERGADRVELAARLGFAADAWSSSAIGQARYTGEVLGPQWSKRLADTVMRATFLSPWTQAGRQTFEIEFSGWLAQNATKAAQDLPPELQRAFKRYGVTDADWDKARAVPLDTTSGQALMNFEDITRAGELDAASRLKQMILTETDFAVPTTTERTRAFLTQGTQAGSGLGELLRSVTLYKSFPVTIVHTHLMRGLFSGETRMDKMKYMTGLMIGTTIMGALGYQSKQIMAGKDPQEMNDPKFIMAAMMQGGGLGIFGDFLFADQNRFGGGLPATLLGPVWGSFIPDLYGLSIGNIHQAIKGDSTNAGREAAKFMKNYTPGSSVWYTRLAVERLLWDELQRMVDPKADASFRQRQKFAQGEYGQKYWWAPGRGAPSRPPNLSEAVQ